MRGVKFKLPVEYNNFLTQLLAPVKFNLYTWYVSQDEIIYLDELTRVVHNDLLDKDEYSGDEFKKAIDNKEYLIYLANIQAYPVGTPKREIRTYEDFIESKCELVFLCADSKYVDIYCKDIDTIKGIYEICINNNFYDVEFITDENDSRTKLML